MGGGNDLTALTVAELAGLLARREASAVELTDACLSRIARHDAALHAFIAVYADAARAAAKAADLARGAGYALGPLHGIPFGLKDLVDLEGKVTTGGSKVWDKRVSPATGTLARRLLAHGMIVAGKTHTVEFAFGAWGTNQHMGAPRNPWGMREARTPGGSSSGSGVAVAGRLVPWAVGTDTGGSVRIPSALCGVTGLKTTVGQVPTDGILPLSTTLDTPGPLARSALDAALLFAAMRGADARAIDAVLDGPSPRGVKGLRLARIPEHEREVCEPAVLAAYDGSLAQLADMGAEIVDVALPFRVNDLGGLTGRLIAAEGYSFLKEIIDDAAAPVDELVRARFAVARAMTVTDYLRLLRERAAMSAAADAALAGVDALLTPTTPMTAHPLATAEQGTIAASHFTRIVNFLGRCALAVPNGFSPAGLPTSLHIVCAANDEAMALRVGRAYQTVTDWHRRAPALDAAE
ncbi:MAG: amidase [Xanthobacteraceae bacterium]|nr:amidase [Xanthobacteraceae bacterium]